MPKRVMTVTRDYLRQVPVPPSSKTYTAISHETIIVNVLEQLKLRGFEIEEEIYRSNNMGDVAYGVYSLKYNRDPEMNMMLAWANSYDKSMRFKCAVGGFVKTGKSCMINADFSWKRKHTGEADIEIVDEIRKQIMNGTIYYENLLIVKKEMKKTIVNKTVISEFLGRAFFKEGLFNKEQMGIIKDEIDNPSFRYNSDPDSLWTYYNYMLLALKRSHPRTWLDEQSAVHRYVIERFNILEPESPSQGGPNVKDPSSIIIEPTPETVAILESNNSLWGGDPDNIRIVESDDPVEGLGLENEELKEHAREMYAYENRKADLEEKYDEENLEISPEEQRIIDKKIGLSEDTETDNLKFNPLE